MAVSPRDSLGTGECLVQVCNGQGREIIRHVGRGTEGDLGKGGVDPVAVTYSGSYP